ncbi:flagellar biosynthesis protein FlhF [Thermochromatium tepidum]|jgi:Flagellar GTP-binding protein|uniref:Flagellar biosynthesis protein FlhF n=1 Tax=Thermochromatium tepidum ATCC 43061 TaxID=316276 RepID=A0A6I6EDT8_THETI|nr:flagellar biosynthesis protein FlhF [Thermochromatium tepidum]QGU33486.1 flagellar biosynthesis protein FlhF [Thermochromatium tepidum ATCC 43061]
MNVRRYQAKNMQDAMRQVREQQGPDAVILSSRRVDGLLEVVAATEVPSEQTAQTRPGVPRAARPSVADSELAAMRRELRDLRALLAQQQGLSERDQWAVRHPLAAGIAERLVECGFDDTLVRSLVGGIQEEQTPEEAWGRLRARLSASIASVSPNVLEHGGVLALVGPTGAGKTTTLCRLALRRIRRLGADSVTLVTLDRQRIGAHRQLQVFGQMAGVPVMLLESERDLIGLAGRCASGHLILVDTAGRSARDAAEHKPFAQIRHLVEVETWLVIPATHQASVLRQVLRAFQGCEPSALVLTKIDEAERFGEILSVLLEQQLGLVFQSDGQRIEEDFHPADTAHLTRLALGEPSPRLQPAVQMAAASAPAGIEAHWFAPRDESEPPSRPSASKTPAARTLGPQCVTTRDSLVLESVVPFRKSMHAAY